MAAKRQSLGTGLDALLGLSSGDLDQSNQNLENISGGSLQNLPIEFLQRGKYQPRRDIDPDALNELASSIENQGVMQPIVVRKIDFDQYEIVAGERRWRATQIAGLETIPAIVKDISDEAAIVMALIENIQREDLNAIEESRALIRLQNEFELTQQQVASAVGKSRSAVTNLMRLASLEPSVQKLLEQGEIELGHAKCLLAVTGSAQSALAQDVAKKGLSVRQTENLIKQMRLQNKVTSRPSKSNDPDILRIQEELSSKVGARVEIHHSNKGHGKLTFKYHSLEELEGILDRIN
jgi:ParB family chromosome partitioning protein